MENKFTRCSQCQKAIPTNSNYCYLCGCAISDIAKQNEKTKKQNAQLEILTKVASVTTDKDDLQMIKGIILQIKNN